MTKMVHYGVPKWCIMMYQNGALWYTKIVHYGIPIWFILLISMHYRAN
jgi:hypothetical protein